MPSDDVDQHPIGARQLSPHAPDFTALLAEGARHDLGHVRDGWTATVRVVSGADLLLPSGRLVACEPTMHAGGEADELAFSQRVEPGSYRVELLVADIVDGDGNAVGSVNAAARLLVSEEPVTTWRLALRDGEDDTHLADDEFYGYPVDGGMGGFASPEVLIALGATTANRDDDSPIQAGSKMPPPAVEAFNKIAAELRDDDGSMDPSRARGLRMMLAAARELARLDTPSQPAEVGVHTDQATGTNLVSFVSGDGDGHYGTWIGYTAGHAIACFLTDFRVVTDSEAATAD